MYAICSWVELNAVQHSAVQCSAVKCSAFQCSAGQFCAVQYRTEDVGLRGRGLPGCINSYCPGNNPVHQLLTDKNHWQSHTDKASLKNITDKTSLTKNHWQNSLTKIYWPKITEILHVLYVIQTISHMPYSSIKKTYIKIFDKALYLSPHAPNLN